MKLEAEGERILSEQFKRVIQNRADKNISKKKRK